jgi:Family of unknown function (DUF6281)
VRSLRDAGHVSRRDLAIALIVIVGFASGCRGAQHDAGTSSGSCEAVVVYRGNMYVGQHVSRPPSAGKPLDGGEIPSCDDTGGPPGAAEDVDLAEIEGVCPLLALMRRDDDQSVYVRPGVTRAMLPPRLLEAVRPLTCLATDEPIEFVAEMRGIAPIRRRGTFDLRAPYDIWVNVVESSSRRYEEGSVRVRVPAELGTPLSQSDVDALRHGARLALSIRCVHSGYVARRVVLRRS